MTSVFSDRAKIPMRRESLLSKINFSVNDVKSWDYPVLRYFKSFEGYFEIFFLNVFLTFLRPPISENIDLTKLPTICNETIGNWLLLLYCKVFSQMILT